MIEIWERGGEAKEGVGERALKKKVERKGVGDKG